MLEDKRFTQCFQKIMVYGETPEREYREVYFYILIAIITELRKWCFSFSFFFFFHEISLTECVTPRIIYRTLYTEIKKTYFEQDRLTTMKNFHIVHC